MRRFGLKTLFCVVLLAAFASFGLNEYLRTRPPSQTAYSSRGKAFNFGCFRRFSAFDVSFYDVISGLNP